MLGVLDSTPGLAVATGNPRPEGGGGFGDICRGFRSQYLPMVLAPVL